MANEFTDKNFDQEVLNSDKPVFVDFWAPWCGPCQVMGPIVDELAKEIGEKIKVGKINVDENTESATKYGIMSIPSMKVFKDGKIVKEFLGIQSKDSLKQELEKI